MTKHQRKKYYVAKAGAGWNVIGPNIRLSFEEKIWAEVICRFFNGQFNSAKGMMVEWEKRHNVDPLDGRTKGKKEKGPTFPIDEDGLLDLYEGQKPHRR